MEQSSSSIGVYRSLFSTFAIAVFVTITAITILLTRPAQAHDGFELFGRYWASAAIQKEGNRWQHVFHCYSCFLTPSLTITSSPDPIEDSALFHELDRSFASVTQEQRVPCGTRSCSVIRATSSLAPNGPQQVTAITAHYKPDEAHYHRAIQVLLLNPDTSGAKAVAEQYWLNVLGHVGFHHHGMLLNTNEETVSIDLSSPDRSLFSDLVEKYGLTSLFLGSAVTTTGVVLLGAQLVLGMAGVRGPCGKPLHQCPCTKRALQVVR